MNELGKERQAGSKLKTIPNKISKSDNFLIEIEVRLINEYKPNLVVS
jgi:hypothetical protein